MFVESGIVDNGNGSYIVEEDANGHQMITVFKHDPSGVLCWKTTQVGQCPAKALATLMCGEDIKSFSQM